MSFLFTCAVIASPERRMLSAIRALPSPLFVGGCMPPARKATVRDARPDAFNFPPGGYDGMLACAFDTMASGRTLKGPCATSLLLFI